MSFQVHRYHDISAGHRVVGHEGKCRYLHGHNYRVHFTCKAAALDPIGRVIDFSVIKEKLCAWLEDNWDHRFLVWDQDETLREHYNVLGSDPGGEPSGVFGDSIVFVPFNPTAENMARFLLEVVGPEQLKRTGCTLISVTIEETYKCSATCRLEA